MKKQIMLLIAMILVFSFMLTACGKSEPTEEANTINFPVVDGGGAVVTEPELIPDTTSDDSVTTIQDTYPVGQESDYSVFDAAIAYPFDASVTYPIDPANPNYDAEMEDYLTRLVGQKHDLQFLLDKDLTAEQWREILTNSSHTHLQLSEGAMKAVIDWLLSK